MPVKSFILKSIWFLQELDLCIRLRYDNHHPCILQVFNDGTNLYHIFRDVLLLLVYYVDWG